MRRHMQVAIRPIVLSAVLCATMACGQRRSREATAPYQDTSVWVNPSADCGPTSPRFLPNVRVSDTVSDPRGRNDSEKISVWLARRVPGGWTFGPMVDSIQHRTLIWMRDTSVKRAALAALDSLAPHGPFFVAAYPVTHPDSVLPYQVRWDYAELFDWMEFLGRPGQAEGVNVTMWAIDALKGRLFFGVETPEMVPIMSRWLVGRGIPCRLVKIEAVGQMQLVSHPGS
jgi:phage tail protein X